MKFAALAVRAFDRFILPHAGIATGFVNITLALVLQYSINGLVYHSVKSENELVDL